MTQIDWLTRYGAEGPSSRYRVLQYLSDLEAAGFTSTVEPLAPWRAGVRAQAIGVARRLRRLAKAGRGHNTPLVVQKEPVMPPALWPAVDLAARRWPAPVAWDVDDAVWIGRRGADRLARTMAERADIVVAGNPSIAEWAESAGAASVTILPTCYEPLGERADPADGTTRVVWIGSPATARLLDQVQPLLEAVRTLPNTQLTFVGGAAPASLAAAPNVTAVDWSPEAEHEALATADFGLAPQPRTEYADHKCGFKIVQYLAYGVVPIATDSPVHQWLLDGHGVVLDGEVVGPATERVAAGVTAIQRDELVSHWRERFSRRVGADAWTDTLTALSS